MSTRERNLSDGFQNIRKFETMLQLPKKVVNLARDLMAQYDEKKEKTMQGARSDAFALAMIFFSGQMHGMGKPMKEIAAMANVPEIEIRRHTKKIQKVIPSALRTGTANDFVRIIVSDVGASMLIERLACEICDRSKAHVCVDDCATLLTDAIKPGTLAAAAILTAGKYALEALEAEDVAMCAQVGVSRAMELGRLLEGHWPGMFVEDGGSVEPLLKQLKELQEKTKAALAPSAVIKQEEDIRI